MAKAYVIGNSALFFWRKQARPERLLKARVNAPLSDCPRSFEELNSIDFPTHAFGQAPIRLMTDCMQNRVLKNRFDYSVRSGALPMSAFCRVSDSLCVASPELCLIQAVKTYSRARLIELCMELCGRYALDPSAQRGFSSRSAPLTSISAITALLSEIHAKRCAADLVPALRFVASGARSPMETRAFLLLCLPKRYGGYGLPRPELNMRVDLDECERSVSDRHFFECDMLWPEQKVVLEYDGHLDHESYDARANDAVKRNILTNKGYQVFTMTGRQLRDAFVFDKAAKELSAALGYRLRQFPKDWVTRRGSLRDELFKSLVRI